MDTVDYQAVLADLRARRARIDSIIAGIEGEILGRQDSISAPEAEGGAGSVAGGVALPVTIHPDTFFGLTIADAVKKFMRMARRAQHVKAIADALDQGGLKRPADNVLSGILVRAAKGREVVKVGKGMWGLAEWYPKQRPVEVEPAPKRDSKKKVRASKPRAKAAGRPLALAAAPAESNNGHAPRGSLSAILRDVLKAADKPIHVEEITRKVNARGHSAKRSGIEGQLNRWVRKGTARKPSPGVFAAVEK